MPSPREPEIDFNEWIMPKIPFRHGFEPGNQNDRDAPLLGVAEQTLAAEKSVDIIICIHNALEDVELCLASVLASLKERHRIILVNDDSDREDSAFLRKAAEEYSSKISLLRTSEQLFFTKSANLGLAKSDAEVAILLNSDTIVPGNLVEKLAHLIFLDPAIGIVGPLSNAANLQSIPSIEHSGTNTAINRLPKDTSLEEMNVLCETWSRESDIPLVPNVHGFCFCIKRGVREKLGYLDELSFPQGYGEDTDYSYRAMDAGYRLAVATDTYVYHSKSRSYLQADRKRLMDVSMAALRKKYPNRIEWANRLLRAHPLLGEMRDKAQKFYQMAQDKNST